MGTATVHDPAELIRTLAAYRPNLTTYHNPEAAYRIRSLARRYLELHDEIAEFDLMIKAIVEELAQKLDVRNSIDHNGAAALLIYSYPAAIGSTHAGIHFATFLSRNGCLPECFALHESQNSKGPSCFTDASARLEAVQLVALRALARQPYGRHADHKNSLPGRASFGTRKLLRTSHLTRPSSC